MGAQATVIAGWRAWLRLVRLPNLFSVPGDVLAGASIAALHVSADPRDLLAALIASLCLYAAGLIMNDLVDAAEDRRERPGRPIASGAVGRGAARAAIAFLLGFALVLLGLRSIPLLATGGLIAALLFAYNLSAKRARLPGSLVMGLCRAGNLLLGVVAVSPAAVLNPECLTVAALWLLFIGSVSWIARDETRDTAYGRVRWLPGILAAAGGGVVIYMSGVETGQATFRAVFCFGFAFILCYQAGLGLGVKPRTVTRSGRVREQDTARLYPKSVGLMISALIPMQAGVLILHAENPLFLLAALLTLFMWPLGRWSARYVPAS